MISFQADKFEWMNVHRGIVIMLNLQTLHKAGKTFEIVVK